MKNFYLKTPPTLLFLIFCFFSFSGYTTSHPFSVTYSGAQEVPANGSAGTGTISGTYDDATNTISYSITFSGLGSNTTAAHFHSPGAPGIAVAPIIDHTAFPTGVTSGSIGVTTHVITDAQEAELLAGLWYSNIHTTDFPDGEIRAQIFFTTAGNVVPDITCPADTIVSNGPDSCARSVLFSSATATGTPAPEISYRINGTVVTAPFVFDVGVTSVTAYALSGSGVDSCIFTVTVNDTQGPVVTCPTTVTQSNDPGLCGAVVNYTPTVTDNCPGSTAVGVPASGTFFPVGTTTVTVTGTDASGNTATCNFDVTVNDTEPPVISDLDSSPNTLWPPNHKLRNVVVHYTSTDNCPGVITCVLSVTSDEAINGFADGNTSPDWVEVDDHLVKLRAERAGNGNGRVYTVTTTCTDEHGNSSSSSTTVSVPHDKSKSIRSETIITDIDRGASEFTLRAMPNPTRNYFTLDIQTGNNTDKLTLKISDALGRIVDSKANLTGSQTLRFGNNLKPGIYFVELTQGSETRYMKLVKL